MGLIASDVAQLAAVSAEDKKARDTIILDIRGLSVIADYFVICSGNSETQVQAIAEEIKDKLNEANIPIKGVEGKDHARWILLDVGDVVVHIFHKDERDYYNLERLWGDAPRVEIKESTE